MATELPHWEDWVDKYATDDLTLFYVMQALDSDHIAALNITRSSQGYMVSVRRFREGWEVYYGGELSDTIARAVMAGPQNPVVTPQPLAPWQEGVAYAFNSEGIEPL